MHIEEFDLTVTSFPFKLKKPKKDLNDSAEVQEFDFYSIHVMTGKEKGDWQNQHNKRHMNVQNQMNDGKTSVTMKMTDYVGVEATLLCNCLCGPHPKTAEGNLLDESGPLVGFEVLCGWPGPLLGALADKARDVNGLNDKAAKKLGDDAKND